MDEHDLREICMTIENQGRFTRELLRDILAELRKMNEKGTNNG